MVRENPRNRSAQYFIKYVEHFNSLYYKFQRVDDYEEFERFQSFLDIYGTDENETYYDILRIVKLLTPNCRNLIVKCFLNGKEIDCFAENAFQEGLTMYGLCCVFNSKDSYRKRNSTFRLITSELGLTVLLNSSHSDDMVPILNMDAYVVIIHNPNDFPDIGSGSAIEVFPMNNEESFIAIRAKFMDTSEELRTFDPSYVGIFIRKCYFDDESPDPDLLLRNTYTFSNCITRCRIRSIAALCSCVPFYMPLEYMDKVGVPYCSLHHVACMNRYNFKWRNVLTKRISILGLEREVEEALYCPQCLPSCDDTQYDISMMSLPTDRLVVPENVGDDFNLKLEDLSVLRVYFGEPTALFYKRVISNTWEEAFSEF
ncbi:pickpocket protein 28-like [Lucilia sericata]|uniref:pickpocket protein 28-like n=1 Tax=Lucilia sericata TaxID=13632 RepID=UPI0018A82BC7|nr:pickpocket protein 28-like [Lucilia sericata]